MDNAVCRNLRRTIGAASLMAGLVSAMLIPAAVAQAPKPKGPEPVTTPPGLRILQGDDARREAELYGANWASVAADRWPLAIAQLEELRDLRMRVQGPEHYQTVDIEWHLKTLRRVAALPLEDRAAFQPAQIMNSQGEALYYQGKYAEAQPLFEKALDIRHRILADDFPQTAESCHNLGMNLTQQGGKSALAQPFLERALNIYRRLLTDDHPDTAGCASNLAYNLYVQKKYAEAEPLFQKGLDVNRRLFGDDHTLTTGSYNQMADSLSVQGKHAQAHPLYDKVLEIHRRLLTDDNANTGDSYNNLANNLDALGKYDVARPLHEKALEILRRHVPDDDPRAIRAYEGLAKNLNAQGKYGEAQGQWQQAVKGLDRARLRIAFAGLERTGNRPSPRADLAAVLARLGDRAKAWQTLEQDLGRGLLDELEARQYPRLTDAERNRLNELTAESNRFDRLVDAAAKGLDQPERAKGFEELKRQSELASIALGEFQNKLVRDHGSPEGKVASLDAIQAALPADAAMIAWVDIPPVGPNAADPDGEHWGIVVRSRGVPSWIAMAGTGDGGLWSSDDIRLADRVRTALRQRPEGAPKDLGPLIEKLRTQRLGPLARSLGAVAVDGLPPARTLIVLPSHDMGGIPVDALLADGDERTVSYAPSATVFKTLRERPRPELHAGLLALGDPAYERPKKPSEPEPPDHGLRINVVARGSNASAHGLNEGDVLLTCNGAKLLDREDLKSVFEPGNRVPVDVWRAGKVDRFDLTPGDLDVEFDRRPASLAIAEERKWRQVLTAVRSGSEDFVSLPWTLDEVKAMARLFEADGRPSRILVGDRASEAELDALARSGELGRFGVIHLATHAVIDERVPARSAAILTQTNLPDPLQQAQNRQPGFDGRLSVREIQRGWDLKAELVTLSACDTALGEDAGGEGFVGFTQALLMSGARSVCLSLWEVNDRATSLLMTRFYENWLRKRTELDEHLSKAEALREAKRWLRGLTREEVDSALDQNARGEKRRKPQAAAPNGFRPFEHPYYWAGFILMGDPS